MTKLLTQMTRARREYVINKLKQEAHYRTALADQIAGDDDALRAVLREWLFGPAAYSIEEFHRAAMEKEVRG